MRFVPSPRRIRIPIVLALVVGIASSVCAADKKKKMTDTKDKKHKYTNRLVNEKSPYLLQHAHNPVDWYPWGEEAFKAAKEADKPILLSVGYSTCHWCHVMERESFENEEIAKQMNENFICVKLDREERPDVDKIYMTFVQAMTQHGGWPLNVFLTPDLKPFFGGTYFPPEPKPGRGPSWPQVMEHMTKLWKERKKELLENADQIAKQLAEMNKKAPGGDADFNEGVLKSALETFKKEYDPKYGGWGRAPKFPRPSQPRYMLRAAQRFGDKEAIEQVLYTCDKMAAGGMYDQIGGGFARYSVDEKWLVPHFEKMLYDNAQLLQLYLDAYVISGEKKHADVARDILRYILRDMTHPDGGFYSAEDADSEGKEGKFYCWTKAELEKLLTKDEFETVLRRFGLTEHGNFHDHSDPEALPNQNVLSIVDPALDDEERKLLDSAVDKMFKEREKRVRPGLDDKVLTSRNGLMLGAVARAYAVLGDKAYRTAAEKNLAFLKSKMWDEKKKRLYHRWRDGEHDNAELLDDHAYLLGGIIELYEATLKPEYLEFAIAIADRMLEAFYDKEAGGFYQSSGSKDLIMRVKEDYDGAEPSGNSVAALALLKLAKITDNEKYAKVAEKTLALFADRLKRIPQATPHMLMALEFSLQEPRRAVIAGDPNSEEAKNLLRAIHSVFQHGKVVLGTKGPVEEFAKKLPEKDGPVVYLCKGSHCELPTSDVAKVKGMMVNSEKKSE